MRIIFISTFMLIMASCSIYSVSGKTGVYVEFSDKILPFYQTTLIEGNTTTDYRHLATISVTDKSGAVIKNTKSDIKGAFILKVKNPGIYTIRAEFFEEIFVEKELEIYEGVTEISINLIVE